MSPPQRAQGFTTTLALIAVFTSSGGTPNQAEAPLLDEAFVKDAGDRADRLHAELKAELSTALSATASAGAVVVQTGRRAPPE